MFAVPVPFITSFLLFSMAGLVFWSRRKKNQNYLFLALILVASLQSFLLGWRWGYGITTYSFISPMLAAVVPPMVYNLVSPLVRRKRQSRKALFIHGIPLILVIAFMIVFPPAIDAVLIVTFVGYAFAILHLMRLGTNALHSVSFDSAHTAYVSIVFAAFSLLFAAMIDTVIFLEFLAVDDSDALLFIMVANVSLLIFIAIAAFSISSHPIQLLPARPQSVQAVSAATMATELEEEDHEQTLADVEALLMSKRLYRDVGLNLDRLSRRLGIPARKVSNAINQCQAKNVSQFVNEFRVMEACQLLLDTNQSVTDIMYNVGFQTKSNFNREFRRVTGKTPLDWRKMRGINTAETEQLKKKLPGILVAEAGNFNIDTAKVHSD